MKVFTAALLLALVAGTATARAAALPPLDAKGVEALLAPDARQGLAASVIEGRFTQTKQLAGLPQPLVSGGRFLVARGQGVEWQVEKPFASRTVITREALIEERNGRTRRTTAQEQPALAAVSRLLLALFALDVAALDAEFRFAGQRDTEGWVLELAPRHAAVAAVFGKALLRGGTRLDSVRLQDARGDVTELRFSAQTARAALEAVEAARFQ